MYLALDIVRQIARLGRAWDMGLERGLCRQIEFVSVQKQSRRTNYLETCK